MENKFSTEQKFNIWMMVMVVGGILGFVVLLNGYFLMQYRNPDWVASRKWDDCISKVENGRAKMEDCLQLKSLATQTISH